MPNRVDEAGGGNTYQKTGGGGSKGSPIDYSMVANMIRQSEEKFDAKLSAVEHRIATQLARLQQIPTEGRMIFLGLVGLASMAGIVLALLAYGKDRTDNGMALGNSVGGQIESNRAATDQIQKNVDSLIGKIDKVIERMNSDAKTK